jgi:hypothetical protein
MPEGIVFFIIDGNLMKKVVNGKYTNINQTVSYEEFDQAIKEINSNLGIVEAELEALL